MIPGEIFTRFAEFQGIVSVNDFWFPFGFQELLQASLGFLWSFVFCTDTPGSIEWVDPAPRLHINDCYEIHNCRLGPCDLLLSNHQNLRLEVRLRHCVFCMGALVILVRLQISQFRSLGKWVCLPKSSRVLVVGWNFMRRTGVRASLQWNFIIHQFSLNHSGISEPNGLPRSIVVSFFFGVGLDFIRLPRFVIHQLRRRVFPFSNLNFANCRWRRWGWRRWRRMTLLFHRCPWSWWRCRGRTWQTRNHDWNEVLRVADYPNSVIHEMWFLTTDPFVGIQVFIAKAFQATTLLACFRGLS